MITEIGIMAGRILELLDEEEQETSVQEATMLLDEDDELVLMAAGWLAREGFIHITRRGGICFMDRTTTPRYHRLTGDPSAVAHHSRF